MKPVVASIPRASLVHELENAKEIIKKLETEVFDNRDSAKKIKESTLLIDRIKQQIKDQEDAFRLLFHDVRNSMVGLVTIPDLLIMDGSISNEGRELVKLLKIRAQRAIRILEIYTLNSQFDFNTDFFEMSLINFADSISDAVSHLEDTAKIKSISFNMGGGRVVT